MLLALFMLFISMQAVAVDTTPPVITVTGSLTVTVNVFSTYKDAGATATDNVDGSLTKKIVTVNPVNTSVPGTYIVTYNVKDAAGNAAVQKTRTVKVVDTTAPVITMSGSSTVTINVFSTYTDAGATATDNVDGTLTNKIVTVNTVNMSVIGTYYVTYNVSDKAGNAATQKTRTVKVVDATKPVITLNGSQYPTLQVFSTYTEFGATASDNYDGDLTSSIVIAGSVNTSVLGSYPITYTVKDSSNNTTVVTRTVKIVDSTKPIITLLGSSVVEMNVGGTYVDTGATAFDNYDGDLTSQITTASNVNTKKTGTYSVTYNVKDASNNPAVTVTRTVKVYDTGSLISVSPAALVFDAQSVGTTSAPLTLTITNIGNQDLQLSGRNFVFEGTNPNDFVVVSYTIFPGKLKPGMTASFNVAFTPTAAGVRSATLPIRTDAKNGIVYLSVAGTGIDVPVPTVSSFAVNNNADSTTSTTVTLNNSCSGTPTQYLASELSDFSGASWQPYSTAPSFVLSSGNGTKTVYFKVMNAAGVSGTMSDTITLNETVAPTVSSFNINNGDLETTIATVTLNNVCMNNPTQYIASESLDFAGAVWQPYTTAPSFVLSSGNGIKTVYFKVINEAGESAVVSDTISLNTQVAVTPTITNFSINNGDKSTTNATVTLNNVCADNPTHYMASESLSFSGASWLPYVADPTFTLSSGNGVKKVYFVVKNEAGTSNVTSAMITLLENLTEETILLPGNVPLEMVWIPAGTFLMGAATNEQDSYAFEKPQHQVTLTQGFWMGKYELTKRQWTALMGTSPWLGKTYVLDDPDSPAVYISWNDAQSFITTLNRYTGLTFRLPSEAQWEYAARANTTTRFYWGDDSGYTDIGECSWYWGNCSNKMYAHVTGQKYPNGFGLYDMLRNAWELCQDWATNYILGSVTDPTGPAAGTYHIGRGGSWSSNNNYSRTAIRGSLSPAAIQSYTGFRLIK